MEYWKDYWNNSVRLKGDNPHVKVGRTVFGKPISHKDWERTLNFLEKKTLISKDKNVLDLCCGVGLISIPFANTAKSVTSIDYSDEQINELKSYKIKNINSYCLDVKKLNLKGKRFDIIIIYFAIQYFSQKEVINLLKKAKDWLNSGGCIYVGDIPDDSKIWQFFHTKKFRGQYFDSLLKSEPVLGNWFTKDFFKYLGEYLDYKKTEVIRQPNYMINHHYRFDVLLKN